MRVSITGHTSGIGKALFDRFSPSVIGFSRSNGFDVANNEHREQISKLSIDCDLFINNAYSNFAQVNMLFMMHNLWVNTNKMIINISSNSSDGIKNHSNMYSITKSALDKASEQLNRLSNSCKIINLRPGYVNTPRVNNIINVNKMSIDSIVHCINFIIDCPNDCIINNLTVLPWKNN